MITSFGGSEKNQIARLAVEHSEFERRSDYTREPLISWKAMQDPDTDIGGPQHRFPITRHSAIIATRSTDAAERQRAFAAIVESYWKPAYKYVRFKWQAANEDAKDLIQGFFATAIEKNYFGSFDADKASFQTFLRTCLDRFVANQKKADERLKRGGNFSHLSLDFAAAEAELAQANLAANISPEDLFHREWIREMFSLAVEALRVSCEQKGNDVYFKLFERYDLHEDETATLSYASLAEEFGLTTVEVTNYLAAARREFRRTVVEKLRAVTASDEEFHAEARALLGIEPK